MSDEFAPPRPISLTDMTWTVEGEGTLPYGENRTYTTFDLARLPKGRYRATLVGLHVDANGEGTAAMDFLWRVTPAE